MSQDSKKKFNNGDQITSVKITLIVVWEWYFCICKRFSIVELHNNEKALQYNLD